VKDLKAFKGLKFRAVACRPRSSRPWDERGDPAGGEIVPALERGVIDAAEYSDPSSDMSVGFAERAQVLSHASVHQPTGIMEILVNKKQWDSLPADLKAVIENACQP